jgi:hypothetical protein
MPKSHCFSYFFCCFRKHELLTEITSVLDNPITTVISLRHNENSTWSSHNKTIVLLLSNHSCVGIVNKRRGLASNRQTQMRHARPVDYHHCRAPQEAYKNHLLANYISQTTRTKTLNNKTLAEVLFFTPGRPLFRAINEVFLLTRSVDFCREHVSLLNIITVKPL